MPQARYHDQEQLLPPARLDVRQGLGPDDVAALEVRRRHNHPRWAQQPLHERVHPAVQAKGAAAEHLLHVTLSASPPLAGKRPPYAGTTTGPARARSVATTLWATIAEVRGFAEATFASSSVNAPNAPRALTRTWFASSAGSAITRARVSSKPIPASATAAATFVVFGKRATTSATGPSNTTTGPASASASAPSMSVF